METGSLRISDIRPDFIYMMEQAVKAPSGHNTQPWLFRVQKDRIQILPDMSKSLPAVDPDNRELFISLGCATENLCIAAEAKGYAPLPLWRKISVCICGRKESGSSIRFLLIYLRGITGK